MIIFVVEGAIMIAFSLLKLPLNTWQEALFDVLLLAIISTPLVYVFGIRPYLKISEASILAEEESNFKMVALNRDLEFQKHTLDEHALVSITDIKGDISYANDKFCELSGYSQQELIGINHRILDSGYHSKIFFADMWKAIASGHPWHGEIKNKSKNGTYYWLNSTIVPFLDENGKPFQYVEACTDITNQKIMEEDLRRAQNVANIGSWALEIQTNHLTWSNQIFKIFGIDRDRFSASVEDFFGAIHPDDLEYVKEQYERSVNSEFPYDIDHRIIRRDTGEVRWVHEMCIHQYNDSGEAIRSDGTLQDITERKKVQDEVQRLAMTDQLTGLPNRNQFFSRFENMQNLVKREKKALALLLLDLDKFKPVNDTFGHQTGDDLLRGVARIFQNYCRETDIVARLGGDEFAILLFNPVDSSSIDAVAQRILSEFNKPIYIRGKELSIGVSIGVSQYPIDGTDQDDLIEKSDLALYQVKNHGRNDFCIYRPELKGRSPTLITPGKA